MGSFDGPCIRTSSSKPIPIILPEGKLDDQFTAGGQSSYNSSCSHVCGHKVRNFNALISQALMKSGLTVGVLVASALVAGTTSKEANAVERVDHSWEDILGTSPVHVIDKADVIEAEGEMKHEDRLEIQKGKADRKAAESKAEAKAAAEDKKDKA